MINKAAYANMLHICVMRAHDQHCESSLDRVGSGASVSHSVRQIDICLTRATSHESRVSHPPVLGRDRDRTSPESGRRWCRWALAGRQGPGDTRRARVNVQRYNEIHCLCQDKESYL